MIETRVSDLTEGIQPIAEQMGVEMTLKLVKHFGGSRLYIPQRWNASLDLNVLGEDVAQTLCSLFGPERIDLPLMPYTATALKRYADALRGAGQTNGEIARTLGISWRTVARLSTTAPLTTKRRRALDARQLDIEDFLPKKAG